MKSPRTSIRSIVKQAYKNRYGFESVTISKEGNVMGYLEGNKDEHKLGNLQDYSTERTEGMNIRLKHGNALIFTFAYDK